MERGPMALFGALVAVGLGPAMWLGAQFGESTVTPGRPPAVTVKQNDVLPPQGGTGAGDVPVDSVPVLGTTTAPDPVPQRISPERPQRVESPPVASPSTSETSPAPDEAESSSPAPEETDEPSFPPTESTSEPAPDPTDDSPSAEPDPTDPSVIEPTATQEQATAGV